VGVSSQAAEICAIEPLSRRAGAAAEAAAAAGGGGGGGGGALGAAAPAGGSPARGAVAAKADSGAAEAAAGEAAPAAPAEIEALRTGDRANITFKYCYRPEYLRVGDTLLFREGRCKGVGRIVQLLQPHGGGGAAPA
jgi:hypothetical protein